MGFRAMALLLLTLAVTVAMPSSSAAVGGRGARTGSSMEAVSIKDTDAVFYPSPAQDQEEDLTGTKSTSTLKSAGAASRESSFTPEAYPVKWNHKRDHNPPHGGVAAQRSSFTPEAYPVKWNHKRDHNPPHDGVAAQRSSFTPEAYPVKWNHKRDHNPPHDGVASQRSSFTPEAYPVKWNHKRDHNPPHGGVAAQRISFVPEAYPVKWNHKRDHNPPHGGVATQQSFFMPEAYPVKWNHKRDQNPPHGGVATHPSSFTPEAYPVKWNHKRDHSPPHGDAATQHSFFTPEAYPVKWNHKRDHNPPHDGIAAQQSFFTPEAYPVKWNHKRDHNPPHVGVAAQQNSFTPDAYVAETTLAASHDDDLHVATGMLFTRKSLFPGAVLPEGTKFAGNGFPDPRRFVSREDADAIPFSYKQVDTILRTFGIPRGSKKADQVAATLRTCEAESSEPHTCATSEQAELDFVASSLATRTSELRAVVTVVHGKEDAARYTVAPDGVARIGKAGGGAMVPCHLMAYPYLVHYCHRPTEVEAIRVELMGLGDDHAATTTAIALCHANTTSWDARYFQMVNATRGEEMCHFMPRNYVLWLPAAAL